MNNYETAVLSGLFVKPEKIEDVIEILSPMDFSSQSLGMIYKAMIDLHSAGTGFDVISISEKLGNNLHIVGGIGFLSELFTSAVSSANIVVYAHTVKDFKRRSELSDRLQSALSIVDQAKDYETASNAVGGVLDSIEPEVTEYQTFNKIVGGRIAELKRRFESGVTIEGLVTGFKSFDDRFLGLRAGDLWVLGGRPAMGKTAFALNVVENVVIQGGEVLVFSCEMEKEQLADRMISRSCNISAKKLRTAKLENEDWSKLAAGVTKIKDLPVHIIDTAAIDVQHAINIARKFNRRKKLSLIVIDYLQLMRYGKLRDYECVSEVSRSLKTMAKDLKCPVLALSQLSRDVENRADKRPLMSDLRASGQIEQDADVITFVYRDEHYNEDSQERGIAEFIHRKVRSGETGTDRLACDLSKMDFKDLVNYIPPPPVEKYKPFAS